MVRHRRRLFQCAAALELGRDPGRPETVVADLRRNAGRLAASLHHIVGMPVGQGRVLSVQRELVSTWA